MSLIQDIEATIAHNTQIIEAERIRTKGEDTMTMETKTYNGWTNYETWCVNLWLTNEPSTAEELATIIKRNGDGYEASHVLREFVDEIRFGGYEEHPIVNMFVDLLNTALGLVNWREIIENHLDD